jgi:hypothetical protein
MVLCYLDNADIISAGLVLAQLDFQLGEYDRVQLLLPVSIDRASVSGGDIVEILLGSYLSDLTIIECRRAASRHCSTKRDRNAVQSLLVLHYGRVVCLVFNLLELLVLQIGFFKRQAFVNDRSMRNRDQATLAKPWLELVRHSSLCHENTYIAQIDWDRLQTHYYLHLWPSLRHHKENPFALL